MIEFLDEQNTKVAWRRAEVCIYCNKYTQFHWPHRIILLFCVSTFSRNNLSSIFQITITSSQTRDLDAISLGKKRFISSFSVVLVWAALVVSPGSSESWSLAELIKKLVGEFTSAGLQLVTHLLRFPHTQLHIHQLFEVFIVWGKTMSRKNSRTFKVEMI